MATCPSCLHLKTAEMPATTADAAAPPLAGSMQWYAWLYTPPPARDVLRALLALEPELRSIASAHIDHGVAHLKLQWWREEIQRLAEGAPRHPLTRAIQQAAPEARSASLPLQDLLSAVELDLARASFASAAELDRYFDLADGLQRALVAAIHAPHPPDCVTQFASAIGQAVRGVEIIRDRRQDVLPGRTGLQPESLAARSRDQWRRAQAAIAGGDFAALRGQRVYGALHIALLDHIERGQFHDGGSPAELGSVKCLWTAWRTARQH